MINLYQLVGILEIQLQELLTPKDLSPFHDFSNDGKYTIARDYWKRRNSGSFDGNN
jgi:hypothetical protein